MIVLEQSGGVATVTMAREDARNALDSEMVRGIHIALDRLGANPTVRVLVLTGAGDRAFCAGADLAALAAHPGKRRAAAREFSRLVVRLATFSRPVIARVNGACVAGGMALFLAADLAVAHEGVHFSLPEGNVGMWPMVVGALLQRVVGRRVALDLALTGRKVDAAEALRLGLVNRVVSLSELDFAVDDLAARVGRMSPSALRLGRAAWAHADGLPFEPAVDYLGDQLAALMETDDATEGFLSFVEKREPVWKDR